jgi:hypothetical protein
MSASQSTALIEHLVAEVYTEGREAGAAGLYARMVRVNGELVPLTELQAAIRELHRLVPGFAVTAEVLGGTAEWVVARWTVQRRPGTGARGEAGGSPARGWSGLRLFRIQDGQIVAVWYNWAAKHELQQLGVPALVALHTAWP